MARILSHPFRLTAGGAAATVAQDSDTAAVEQVAVLALTQPGERVLVPAFGVHDPAFAGFEVTELAAGIAAYGPPVRLKAVEVTARDDGATQQVAITLE